MLPFSGQGANQGLEGSGILGEMFRGIDADSVPERVAEFERMRIKRITMLKLLSRIRFGKENNAAYSSIKHERLDPKGMLMYLRMGVVVISVGVRIVTYCPDIPQTFHERLQYEWKYNVFEEFRKWQEEKSLENGHADRSP